MTREPWASMLVVAAAFLVMFAIGELLHRRARVAAAVTRKFDHLAAGGIALGLPLLFDSPWPVVALAAPFLAFLLGTMVLGWLGSVHAISRRSAGAFLYPVSIAATFVLASHSYPQYAVAVLALAIADVAAAVAGGRWGRHPYSAWGQIKTSEGSVVAFAITGVMTCSVLLLSDVPFVAASATGVFTGVVVALVEGALPWGLDNLGIPLAALASLNAGSMLSGSLVLLCAAALFALALAVPRLHGARYRRRSTRDAATPHAE